MKERTPIDSILDLDDDDTEDYYGQCNNNSSRVIYGENFVTTQIILTYGYAEEPKNESSI